MSDRDNDKKKSIRMILMILIMTEMEAISQTIITKVTIKLTI